MNIMHSDLHNRMQQNMKKFSLLRNPRIHDGIHKSPALDLILSKLNRAQAYTLHFFEIHFNIIIHDDTYISYSRYTTSTINRLVTKLT
jgi:hypothetical protein